MLVLPPPGFPDSRPVYTISVSLNCLNPFSFITTIHKSADLHVAAEFEMGKSTIPSTVCVGAVQKKIKDAIYGKSRMNRWVWKFRPDRSQHLRWELVDEVTGLFNCYMASEKFPSPYHAKIAQFKGASLKPQGTEPTPLSKLRIYPVGQALFDDILLSILIIERRRLSPGQLNEASSDW